MNPSTRKQRIGLKGELLLAAMPTLSVLLVLVLVLAYRAMAAAPL